MWDETREKLYDREIEFVETESSFINGKLSHTKEVAQAMAQDHRYLVNERTKLVVEYLKELAKNHRKGYYDPRNEWACKVARVAIDALIESEVLYIPWDEREDFGMAKAA